MLQLKDIRWSTETGESILNGVDLTVPDGKLTVITGPNGGGKTSLAKVIAGLYKPESGQIIADGKDITDWSITERSKNGLAYAFQQPVRFKGLTVKDLLELAAGKEMKASACDYLSEVGLCAHDYINREINASLSGGELKRIEIAITIARGTKLTIFDEPEAGIDLWSFSNLIKVFEDLKKKTMGSIIIISHQERIINKADELILIANGEVVKQGGKEDIMPLFTGTSFKCKFK